MAANYRMRAFDSTLARYVFWTATIIDTTGAQYTGPGPLTNVVIQSEVDGGVNVEQAGSSIVPSASQLNFVSGATVANNAGVADVTISGGSSGVDVEQAGSTVVTGATHVNFVSGATVANNAGVADVTVPNPGVAVKQAGSTIVSAATQVNFVSGATVANNSGVADVTIPSPGISGVVVEQAGSTIVSAATHVNFVSGATVANNAGVADVTVPNPGVVVEQAGSTIVSGATHVNFVSGATVSNNAGVADVTISGGGGGVDVQQAGSTIVAGATTVNFVSGATVTDNAGVADVAIDGGGGSIDVQQEGEDVVNPASILNFQGAVAVTDAGGGEADILIGIKIINTDTDTTITDSATGIRFSGFNVVLDGSADGTVDVSLASAPIVVTIPASISDGFQVGQVGYVDPSLVNRFTGAGNDGAQNQAECIGMVFQNQSGGSVKVCVAGPVTQSDWSIVSLDGTSLTIGSYYYVTDYEQSYPGMITSTKPTASGAFVTIVGYAVAADTIIVRPEPAVLIP